MNETDKLIKISIFFQRLALFMFIFIWAEIIFYFTDYSSPGQLFYKEYGINGISTYYLIIMIFVFLFSVQSKKINDIAYKISKTENWNK